jgi:hypothetical protein
MKQKGSALIIILILILLTVIGFFVYKDYLSPKGTILGPFVPFPTATADPTASWKTYTNNDLLVSLRYPAENGLQVFSYSTNKFDVTINSKQYAPLYFELVRLPNENLQDWYQKAYSATKQDQVQPPDLQTGPQVGGLNSYEANFNLEGAGKITFIFIQKDKDLYEIHVPTTGNETQFQILSTFKFTGSTTSGPEVTSPVSNSKVASPLTVTGTVPAGWMFEGVFPIKLVDANRKLIVQGQAKETVAGSWQSGNTVDFTATLTFNNAIGSGFLILQNDNPSGDPANSKTFEVPVSF